MITRLRTRSGATPSGPRPSPRRRRAALVSVLAGGALACGQDPGKVAYVGATLIDGSGGPPVVNGVIVVNRDRIEAIGPADAVAVPRNAFQYQAHGMWIIPGLIDAHAHTPSWSPSRYLAYGVTSVRDMGGPQEAVFALRDQLVLGSLAGPRLYPSGAPIDGPGSRYPDATIVSNASEARRAVDALVLLEAQQAKVLSRLDRRLMEPLLDEASTLNLPVAAHLGKVDALTAAQMGVRSLEHLGGVVEATVPNPAGLFRAHDDEQAGWRAVALAWATLDSAALERTAQRLASGNVWVVPTLVRHEAYARLTDRSYIETRDMDGVPDSVLADWDVPSMIRRAGLSSADFTRLRRGRDAQDLFLRRFAAAGGWIAAGTDAPRALIAPGAGLHDELELLVRAGLTPAQALLAATRDAARLLRTDSIGTLQAGYPADFVILRGDPLEDIKNVRLVELVVSRGGEHRLADRQTRW